MTKFEEAIKREITRDKYMEIMNHCYGDGKNTFNYTYGHVSSWLTWNRNEKYKISGYKRGKFYFDGPMGNWDQDIKLPIDRRFSSRLTTDVVFVGLNMSGNGKPPFETPFQNARGDKKIVNTFFNTSVEGGYFTDIIKPDKRLLDNIGKPADKAEVLRIVRNQPVVLKEHIRLFKEELDFIGAVKPLLIVFGNDALKILEKGMDYKFIEQRFTAIVELYHYACYMTDENYKNDCKRKLASYITI